MNQKIQELAYLLLKAEQVTTEEFKVVDATPILDRDWLNYERAMAAEERLRDQLVAHVLWAVQFGEQNEVPR